MSPLAHARFAAAFAFAAILPPFAAPPARAQVLGRATVAAGESPREDAPVSVVLPDTIDPNAPLRLVEVAGEARVPVPVQIDPIERSRAWWILSGKTEPGATRVFEFERGVPPPAAGPAGDDVGEAADDGIEVELDDRALEIEVRDRTVFRYNVAHVDPPEGVDKLFLRNAYIHPLFSPRGKLLTEDFPSDHYHHKGIWFPWTRTRFDGHPVDFWNLGEGQGTVRFAGFESLAGGPVFAGFVARHEHVDLTQGPRGKVALTETWDVRVWNVGGPDAGYWLFDLVSTQRCASDSPLVLEEYRYGGLGFRGAKEWKDENYRALSSEGKTHLDGHTTKAKWCDHAGAIDGEWAGVTVMDHPENFRFPQPMRLWDKGGAFFNYAPVQSGEFAIEPGKDYVSRYRFFVHEGEVDRDWVERKWKEWGEPAGVAFEALGQ